MVWYEQNQMKVRHFLLLSFKMFSNVMLLYPLTFTSAFCMWLTIGSFVDNGSSGNSWIQWILPLLSHFIYFTTAHLIEILLTRNSLHLQTSAKRPDSVDGSVNRSCDLKDEVAGESRQTDGRTRCSSFCKRLWSFWTFSCYSSPQLRKTQQDICKPPKRVGPQGTGSHMDREIKDDNKPEMLEGLLGVFPVEQPGNFRTTKCTNDAIRWRGCVEVVGYLWHLAGIWLFMYSI